MHLRVYIALLERGGECSDNMMADTTEWNNIMGPVEKRYGYPELSFPALRPSSLGPWIQSCRHGHVKTPYYAMAFQ